MSSLKRPNDDFKAKAKSEGSRQGYKKKGFALSRRFSDEMLGFPAICYD